MKPGKYKYLKIWTKYHTVIIIIGRKTEDLENPPFHAMRI